MYAQENRNLTQNEALENLRAIISSDYFGEYTIQGSNRIGADIIKVNSIGTLNKNSERSKVKDLASTLLAVVEGIKREGKLEEVFIGISPSEEKIRKMNFEEKLYEEDTRLPLTISIQKQGDTESQQIYEFTIYQLGFKESYLEELGCSIKDSRKKIGRWYKELTLNLKKILPHKTVRTL